jgi:peptidoglycan hydrolase-like protein with peptidoglycan-binding domain
MKTLMTVGCALVLGAAWSLAPASAEDVKTKAERAGDKIEDKAERAKDKMENKAERAGDKMESKTERAKDKIGSAMDKAKDKARDAKEKLETKADRAETKNIQQALREKGVDPGPIDGVMGPRTRAAIREFQQGQGLVASGRVDDATAEKLGITMNESRTDTSASPSTATPPAVKRQNP